MTQIIQSIHMHVHLFPGFILKSRTVLIFVIIVLIIDTSNSNNIKREIYHVIKKKKSGLAWNTIQFIKYYTFDFNHKISHPY